MRSFAPVLLTFLLFCACGKKDPLSPIPQITFINLSPNTIQSGQAEDTTYLNLRFFDGDADLGGATGNISLTDSRDGKTYLYDFPAVDDELRQLLNEDGLRGEAVIELQASAILSRTDSLHSANGDTLTYDVFIKDQAGHESNHFRTSALYIRP